VLGLEVEQRTFPDPGLRAGPFDVVYMGHVLEHLASPSAGIEITRTLLRPGGLLVVEVPTYIDSAYFRGLRRMLPALRGIGLDAPELLRALKFPSPGETMQPFHLYEFRRRTLAQLLERFGYQVLRTESRVPKPDSVARARGLVRRAIGLGFDALDLGALRLGLPGGNISAFARRAG
jgi:2-polyprenyl-3-methyl-5-hydroxy-6-metoxy-1,4-benzoquinol methylase